MPPAESTRELAIQAVEAAMAGIVAGADYWTTVRKVIRYEEYPDDLDTYPAVMVIGLDTEENERDYVGRQTVWLNLALTAELDSIVDYQQNTSRILDDMNKALLSDPTLGGVVRNAQVLKTTPWLEPGENPRCGGTVLARVQYRHAVTDPYTPG